MANIPLATVERMLRDAGAKRVSKEATRAFADYIEKITQAISSEAGEFADHFGRKTITEKDANLARKRLK
jgi:DNA-binding protein